MSFSIQLGNFLFKNIFSLYKPMYWLFKKRQDNFEIKLLQQEIKKGDIVLDIGANIGFYAEVLSNCVGENGKVHCFEPDEKNFSYLKILCANFKNVMVNNLAVNSNSEKIKIYTSKELNVDHRTYKPEEYENEIEIEAISIDDYCKKNNITKVDFIKIDIQGFEIQAMKGALNTIKKNKHLKIISEFWPYGLSCAGSSVFEYYNLLIENNFKIFLLEKNNLSELNLKELESIANKGKEHYYNIFAIPNV